MSLLLQNLGLLLIASVAYPNFLLSVSPFASSSEMPHTKKPYGDMPG